jgi:hypothetical protein
MSDEPTTNQKIAALLLQQTYDERRALASEFWSRQDDLESDPTTEDYAYWLGEWAKENQP